ncbi:O-antigen ligase family protein [Mycetocola reblochoni]|uniref:Exopolysaccharide production protein n=2 Tax=Mycetocola reblochoni TaxID=331618 RepID=A0A1R4K111_9MICO|nr:O-antigen ligase family protein [Mycetocola reblochoni]RLP70457.1 O-antigen ligase family protein [Mycetocola reblochoni]SJN38007.1 Exopolysaccharide production protein [Mycetocola reblochoni REB411]
MTTSSVPVPLDQSTPRQIVRAIAAGALIVALGGDALRNALGVVPALVVTGVAGLVVAIALIRARPTLRIGAVPRSLVAYLGLAVLSLIWSAYPAASAVTLVGLLLATAVGLYLALLLSWSEILRALSRATATLLVGSLLFELWVSLVVRAPVFPAGFVGDPETATPMSMWSRNLLFTGDRIQGLPGNSNLLGMIALLGLIVAGIRLAQEGRRPGLWFLVGLSALVFVMTRSSTVVIAAAAAAAVLGFALWVRSAPDHRARGRRTLLSAAATLAALAAVAALWPLVLAVFGKSSDLTGRLSIWEAVIGQAERHPIIGNGFASPWVPWAEPFDTLVVRNEVLQLQAHNAWLDVWMQLGAIGVVLFACLVVGAVGRSWFRAVDQPRTGATQALSFSPLALLPLLIVVVLVVQSLMESRVLIESGWVLFTLVAVKTSTTPQIVPDTGAAAARAVPAG